MIWRTKDFINIKYYDFVWKFTFLINKKSCKVETQVLTKMAEEKSKEELVRKKLKNSVLCRLGAQNPSISINSHHASFVEDRIQQVFKSFHTPNHPPYAVVCSILFLLFNYLYGTHFSRSVSICYPFQKKISIASQFLKKCFSEVPFRRSWLTRSTMYHVSVCDFFYFFKFF